jgi:uncharacterized membrane protein YbhN (UPF0104 family)
VKAEVSELPPSDAEVVIEPPATVPNVRRAADVLRLIVALATLLIGLLVATLAHRGVRSTERALLETIVTLPAAVPGGLGALEAALVAGLSALGMPVGLPRARC